MSWLKLLVRICTTLPRELPARVSLTVPSPQRPSQDDQPVGQFADASNAAIHRRHVQAAEMPRGSASLARARRDREAALVRQAATSR